MCGMYGCKPPNQIRTMCKKSGVLSPSQTTSLFLMLSLSRVGLVHKQMIRLALPAAVRGIKTVPQPPGYIVGTVNDAYIPPKASKAHGSRHWTSERVVAAGLLPLVAASFTSGASVAIDTTLSTFMLYHCYTGFQACITDYIPSRVYAHYHDWAMYLLTFGTGVAGYGIYTIEQKEEGGVAGIVAKVFRA